ILKRAASTLKEIINTVNFVNISTDSLVGWHAWISKLVALPFRFACACLPKQADGNASSRG
ncbi:MAG TPA: hypothetical protein V6D20_03310, partial [Candidatus Obscuribacterales bacterium]